MSSDPNPVRGDPAKFSYPRKVLELGKSHINTTTFNKVVETEPDPSVKKKGLSDIQESKSQVNDLAKALQPRIYFRDKPSIATTTGIKGIHHDIAERREDFESESNIAKAREELLKDQSLSLPTISASPRPHQPISSPLQQYVNKPIINYKGARLSQDSVKHAGPAATTTPVQVAVERPPSEAYSLSQIPRAPSLDQPPQALPPPPRPRREPGAQTIATPVWATSGQAQGQQSNATDIENIIKVSEPTGSMKPKAPLVLAAQSSTTSGQVSRKGKHRRGINTGGADDKQEQPVAGTFGQRGDFIKAGINPDENFVDNK